MKHSSQLSSLELKTSTFKPAQIDCHAEMIDGTEEGDMLIDTAQPLYSAE